VTRVLVALGSKVGAGEAAEVAADWVWPGAGGTIGELAAALVSAERLTRLADAAEVAR